MTKHTHSKICFTIQQIQILKDLSLQYKPPTDKQKIPIKKITQKFNKSMTQRHPQFQIKSAKAIRNKINQIENITNHKWSNQQHQAMLDLVGDNKNWKQIELHPLFKNKIKKQQIKVKFESYQRSKFKILFRKAQEKQKNQTPSNNMEIENDEVKAYNSKEPPHIRDPVLKDLFNREKILQKYKIKVIQQAQKNALLNSISFFATHLDSGQQSKTMSTRSYKTRQTFLSNIQYKNLTVVVKAIIKINEHHKKQKINKKESLIQSKIQTYFSCDNDNIEKLQESVNNKQVINTPNPNSNCLSMNQMTMFPTHTELLQFNEEQQDFNNECISQNSIQVGLQSVDDYLDKTKQPILFTSLLEQYNHSSHSNIQ